ncbi:hypothetical protein Tco_0781477 [Tanacetum coccineum]
MGRDTIQLEDAISTISEEYLLEFTLEYGIPESLHPELPGLEETFVDFSEVIGAAKVDGRILSTVVAWRTSALKDKMPSADSFSTTDVARLDTPRTPFQKQPELLLCLVGLSRSYFLGDDVYPTFLYDDDREMDLFNLISAPNPSKVKTGTRPRAAHEVPLLTVIAIRVIEMEDMTVTSGSLEAPSTLEKSPLDFANENPTPLITEGDGTEDQVQDEFSSEIPPEENPITMEVVPELENEVVSMGPRVNKRRRKRANDEADANAPPKSTCGGKSLASMELEAGSTFVTPAIQEARSGAKSVSGPDPLSYAIPQSHPERDIAQSSKKTALEIPSENVATTEVQGQTFVESPESGKSASFLSMDGSPGGNFSELRHLSNTDFLSQYNVNLAWQVAMGSQLRLGTVDTEVQDLRNQSRNLGTLLEAEFKKYEDEWVNSQCAEIDARLDALSIDFDEELYPHMLTAIAGHHWVIGHGLPLAIMKCAESTELRQVFSDVVSTGIAKGMSEGLKHEVEQGMAKLDLGAIDAYDPKGDTKYVAALHALKDLKYPLVDQLEKLKDAPVDLIMVSLHLESDFREDAPQWIHELRPSSSQLKVPVYPEGLAILLADAARQTKISEDKASSRLLRSKSLPPMYNLDWP